MCVCEGECLATSGYDCALCACSIHRGQKRAFDALALKLGTCELPAACWEVNSSPLTKHQLLLTAEPSSQS